MAKHKRLTFVQIGKLNDWVKEMTPILVRDRPTYTRAAEMASLALGFTISRTTLRNMLEEIGALWESPKEASLFEANKKRVGIMGSIQEGYERLSRQVQQLESTVNDHVTQISVWKSQSQSYEERLKKMIIQMEDLHKKMECHEQTHIFLRNTLVKLCKELGVQLPVDLVK